MADDPWAAFAGTPGADQAATAPPAASDDRWAAFAGTPPAAPQQGFTSVQPRMLGQGEPGYDPDPDKNHQTNLSPEDWAKFYGGGQGSAQQPAATQKTGRLSNVAAGGNEAIANAAGLPVDIMTGALNLVPRGINAVAGTNIPLITDPVGGSASIRKAMGLVGANPDDVVQQDGLDRVLRAAGGGAVSAAIPAGVGAAAVRLGMAAPAAVDAALNVFGRATPGNAAVGAGAAVAGEQAGEFVPEPYKPLANVVGGVVGGGALGAAGAGVNKLMQYVEPRNIPSRTNALYEAGTGAPIVGSDGKPVTATPGQAAVAGRQLEGMMADPAAARTALADAADPATAGVPGSQPSTFQVTQDPVLGQYERGMARSGPEASAAFGALADQQNAARVQAIRGIAPEGDPAVLVQQAQAADPAPAGAARVTAAQGRAGQALDAVPAAGIPAGAEDRVGAALRAPAAAADRAAGVAEDEVWRAIDPDGTLGVPSTAIRSRVQQIKGEVSPNAAPLAGEEKAILDRAAQLPDVQSFRDLSAFRSRITDELRVQRGPGGNPQSVRRLSQLLDGVHDAMADTAGRPDVPTPAAAPSTAAAPAASPVAAPNVGAEVFTPSGQRVGVRYELADAGNLVTSHNPDMTPNPAFPQELQPRARDRAASEVQVANIASRLQPERLGASSTVADGAPIVGPDGLVESGNGRVLALRRAYQANGPQAQAYRDWLASQGHDTAGMAQPVLIRRRTTDMTPEQRVAFAGEGSTPTTLAMSATERAAGDARRLPDDVLQQVRPGDVTDPANRDFVRGFLRNSVEPGQEGAFVTADGSLSQEGAARVRAALVHRAYGDQGLSAALAESTDPVARVLAGAMQDAAGPMARLRAGIQAGRVDPGVDLAPSLVEAARTVQQARQRGVSLADAVGQRDMLGGGVSSQAEGLLRAAYGPDLTGRMSREQFSQLLGDFARRAEEQSTNANLFGANLTADQIMEGATARYGKSAATEGRNAPAYASSTRPVDGPSGGGTRESVSGAGRQEAPGGSGGQGRDPRVLEQAPPALTPTWDDAARARYDAARAVSGERRATFRDAPGVGDLLASGPTSGSFRTPDYAAPGTVFSPGAGGADKVRAYLAAGGAEDALSTTAAFMLRREAMRPDGTLDPARYQAWGKRYASALSELPEMRGRFNTAAQAQRAVEDMTAQHAQDTKAFQASLVGKLAGGNVDPVALVGSALRSPATSRSDMAMLGKMVAGNPDAQAGLQRAIADHILATLKGDQLGVGSAETQLHGAQFQKFIRTAAPALREVMTGDQVQLLQAVADDVQRSSLSVSGTRLQGGSDTVQNANAAGKPTLLRSMMQETGRAVSNGPGVVVAGAGGYAAYGPLGAALGAAMGTGPIVARAVANARAAGMVTVNDLVREAMLNPALARVLLSRATPANQASLQRSMAAVLGRMALTPDARSTPAERRRETMPMVPQNALAGLGGGAPRINPLLAGVGR